MILIIEDEASLASALALAARKLGYPSELCASGREGLARLAEARLVLLDIGLPDISGLDVLEQARQQAPDVPIIVITAHGTLENAVTARRLGAAAYLVKPLNLADLQQAIRQILEPPPSSTASKPPSAPRHDLLGSAPAMQRVFLEIAHATTTDAPVLLTGPTGTGKSVSARAIHQHSSRKGAPFVALHCAALPEHLLESELFGHERGAFTGATSNRLGHIERAAGGTLFLDEIGDISPSVQTKLLRFVEERAFTRVGGRSDIRVELRLITATNRNLREEVKNGRFREDLYYRLRVLEINLPPLKERVADIPCLAENFLANAKRSLRLSKDAIKALTQHDWPGNLRELRNAIEHAVAVCTGTTIQSNHLPTDISASQHAPTPSDLDAALGIWLDSQLAQKRTYRELHDDIESMILRHLLRRFDGRPTVLARETGMNRVTLRTKLERNKTANGHSG
jgi:DNA-binding NtrC family response regulator